MLLKILKYLLIGVLILWVIGFLLPNKTHSERMTTTSAKPSIIFSLINDMKNWEKWDPWIQKDPAIKMDFGTITSGKGANYSWTSTHEQVGTGSAEIIESVQDETVATKLSFKDQGSAIGRFRLSKDGDQTKIVWSLDGDNAEVPFYVRPIANFFGLFFMDKMIGPDFEKGLANLKTLAESMPPPPPPPSGKVEKMEVVDIEDMHVIQLETKCAIKDIGPTLGKLYGRIGGKIKEHKLEMTGMPMAMYPGFNAGDTLINLIAMVQTNTLFPGKWDADMKCHTLKSQKVIKAIYFGPYESNSVAYDAITKYMQENSLVANGEPWEEYANDPMEVKDPSLYQTNVYWPVKVK